MTRHSTPVTLAGVVAVVALSLAVGLAGGGAATSARAVTTGSQTFTDGTGDVQGLAPDVTTIRVGDDPNTGTITVTLTAAGYSTSPAETYPLLKVYVDADKNPSTGSSDQGGTEYALGCARDPEGSYWWIEHWNGSKYVDAVQTPTMRFTRTGDAMTWTIDKSDLGVSAGMSFWVWSSSWDASDNQTGEDVAPDDGFWTYDLSTLPLTPPAPPAPALKAVIGTPTAVPARPVAGRRFTIVFPVTRSDNGATLTTGTMICDPSVAGKVLPHSERFKAGKARLSFAVPRAARGKALKVKVTIKVGARSTTRVATFRIG